MRTLVGVGVLIVRDGRVLLGRRRGAHGAGDWALPGGHLEPGEAIADCARREVLEETGLRVGAIEHAGFSADVFAAEERHYVTLFVRTDDALGEPALREPERCEGWTWFDWDALPEPLFAPLGSLVAQGYRPD